MKKAIGLSEVGKLKFNEFFKGNDEKMKDYTIENIIASKNCGSKLYMNYFDGCFWFEDEDFIFEESENG
jgi:hypothetical protein